VETGFSHAKTTIFLIINQAYETLARLESRNDSNEILGKYVDYHFEASEYEKKLIQVRSSSPSSAPAISILVLREKGVSSWLAFEEYCSS
jgi:hypothetical protein